MYDTRCGVLFIATGVVFRKEAEFAAASVKRFMPNLPTALMSDATVNCDSFDHFILIDKPSYSFIDKILPLAKSPFEFTLFLDTDTCVLTGVEDLFELLEKYDLAAAYEPARYLYNIGGVASAFPEINTGVILFRNDDRFKHWLAIWHQLYQEEIDAKKLQGREAWHDQLSFTQMLYRSDLRFFCLPPEFNCRVVFPQYVSGPVRILHGRGKSPHRFCKLGRWLNRSIGPRLLNPNPTRIPAQLLTTMRLFLSLRI
jgi:hypothetical protein